jgi:uncharacterized protein (TIGR02117 family)
MLFIIYLPFCFIIPIIKFGKTKKGYGEEIFVIKDHIHTDYIFESKCFKEHFSYKSKYLKVGWGDRKIFLETKDWGSLNYKSVLFAFFGMNNSVLRIEEINCVPNYSKKITMNKRQLNTLVNYIMNSTNKNLIEKKEEYYQKGDYYESNLSYNCITNCNNWINSGLRAAQKSNRIWCPLSFWI